MISLAIESTTESCSVALDTGSKVLERWAVQPQGHARTILPWASELLSVAGLSFGQLDRLVVSRGPGGFTSLRIGLSIVQGLALAHDLAVYPVSSLEVLAESADPERQRPLLLALLDARMGEIYAAWYRIDDGMRIRIGAEWLGSPDDLSAPEAGSWQAVGPGAVAYRDQLHAAFGSEINLPAKDADITWPSARALLTLADTVDATSAEKITPTYLRDQVTG